MSKENPTNFTVRYGTIDDSNILASVERECFPAAEAATKESIEERLKYYPNHFWLLFDGDTIVSFVDGMVTNENDLQDALYEHAELHDENGKWQMIFGVNTIPSYRKQGCAALLLEAAIKDAREQGRLGVVLTCKEALVHYYAKFGFVNEGVSESVHGGVTWYQMRITF